MILPGKTIGILGGGQLGRMIAFEAKRMGYKVICLDPNKDSPCGQVCDEQIIADLGAVKAALKLAEKADVVTYEFENVKSEVVEAIEKSGKKAFPNSKALKISQNRLREKELFKKAGLETAKFCTVRNEKDLEKAISEIGFPAIIKTTEEGYDGKGQNNVKNEKEARKAFSEMKGELIWEKKVEFEKEISVICARNEKGTKVFPISENIHKNNILYKTIVPARIGNKERKMAEDAGLRVAKELNYTGLFCLELFLMKNGEILVNEMAPRPHNSGHYSIEACVTSQFEQHVRAICGLPLGSTELIKKAVMINILGKGKEEKFAKIFELDNMYLHLYGKKEWKKGRKMGHITILADKQHQAIEKAEKIRSNNRL